MKIKFYQWIFSYNNNCWMVAQFDEDGDYFYLCGNP